MTRTHHDHLAFFSQRALLIAPYAFCYALSTTVGEEHEYLLMRTVSEMIDRTVLSATDVVRDVIGKELKVKLCDEGGGVFYTHIVKLW